MLFCLTLPFIGFILTMVTVLFVLEIIGIDMIDTDDSNGLIMVIVIICLFIFLIFISAVCCGIKQRFDLINRIFKNSSSSVIDMKALASLHIQLYDIITIINQIFSFPVMVFAGMQLFGVIASLFECYDVINTQRDLHQMGFCVSFLISQFYFSSFIFLVIYNSSNASKYGGKSAGIFLDKFNHQLRVKKQTKCLKVFIYQFEHYQVIFSCGMFHFDWKMLFSVSFILVYIKSF